VSKWKRHFLSSKIVLPKSNLPSFSTLLFQDGGNIVEDEFPDGDEILHVFDVRFQNVAGDIETENVDDSFVRRDDFTNFFIDETILELFSSRGVPLKQ